MPPRCPALGVLGVLGGFFSLFLGVCVRGVCVCFFIIIILSRSISHCGLGLDEDLGENIGSGLPHLNAKPFNLFKQYFCSFPSLRKKESAPGAVSDPGVTGPQAAAGGVRDAPRVILSPWELRGRFNIL